MTAGASPHRIVDPAGLAPAVGFAHAVVAAPGRTVYLGGQAAQGPDGAIRGATMAEQLDVAAGNVVAALAAAGGRPEHLVALWIYVTDAAAYRAALGELGAVWRRHFGRHYPATAALAGRLAAGPTLAYGATKALLSRELDMNLSGAVELEAVAQALMMTSADHAEFYAAFTEDREPRWTGR